MVPASKKHQIAIHTARALRKIRKHEPKDLLETSQLGLVCVSQGEGAFRTAYRIKGTSLLIKFPIQESFHGSRPDGVYVTVRKDDSDGKRHTRAEVRKIRALSKFKSLRAHLPPVYYYNSKDGVVCMKYFEPSSDDNWLEHSGPLLSGVIKELTGITLEDIVGDNIKKKENGNLVFVDLGY